MTIAAHLTIDKNTDNNFLFETLSRLAAQNIKDHFIFFVDSPLSIKKITGENITPVLIKPTIKNSLLLYYWYNFKLPELVKRYNAQVFISEIPALSLRLKIPQYFLVKSSSFSNGHAQKKHKRFLQKYMPRFVAKATTIFFTEKHIADNFIQKYPAAAEKNTIVRHGLKENYVPVQWNEKEMLIEKFTDSKDYFLFPVTDATKANIVSALKAFSIFKKWQKSSMLLVLLLDEGIDPTDLIPGFSLYKYKDEVKLITAENNEHAAQITAAAYATIYLAGSNSSSNAGLYALRCSVPLITTDTEADRSMYANAAIFTVINEKNIADQMQLIYRDEQQRKKLMLAGERLAQPYTWQNSSDKIWNAITQKTGL